LRAECISLAFRIAAAVLGGYAFAAAASIWLSYVLPAARADATLTGLLVSFALFAAAIVWAFAARTARRAWLGLLAPTFLFAGLAWLAAPNGAS
jgi:hypothetical protein